MHPQSGKIRPMGETITFAVIYVLGVSIMVKDKTFQGVIKNTPYWQIILILGSIAALLIGIIYGIGNEP